MKNEFQFRIDPKRKAVGEKGPVHALLLTFLTITPEEVERLVEDAVKNDGHSLSDLEFLAQRHPGSIRNINDPHQLWLYWLNHRTMYGGKFERATPAQKEVADAVIKFCELRFKKFKVEPLKTPTEIMAIVHEAKTWQGNQA